MAAKQKRLELSLAGRDLTSLPKEIGEKRGDVLTKLDLSDNRLQDFENFDGFEVLDALILDRNDLHSLQGFPSLPALQTLWLNNNHLDDLVELFDVLSKQTPALTYLSLLMNPCCPNVYFSDGEQAAYRRYRLYTIYRLPQLQFLDSSEVTEDEREEAKRVGANMVVRKPMADGLDEPGSVGSSGSPAGGLSAMLEEEVEARRQKQKEELLSHKPRAAAFLARGKPRYDGSNSEGNRFIMNDDL